MKQWILLTFLATATTAFLGCGTLQKNGEATALAATKTTSYQYKQTIAEIEKAINEQVATMALVGNMNGSSSASTETFKSPLERKLNLARIRFDGKFVKVKDTKREYKSYNLLEETPTQVRFISKRMSAPSDESYALYTIKDNGAYRTVEAKTIENLVVTRESKNAVQVSVMGIGVNYDDYYDIDQSLKKAYVDEKEQWMVLNRVDSASAKKLFEDARAQVEGQPYQSTVN
jgi:hypothetical protein